jgi:two-component system phosphate regulon sensor histidine kinase PhoR
MSKNAPLLLINAIPIPAFAVLRDARIAAANSAATHILGAHIIGLHYITALRQPDMLDAIELSARTSQRVEAEYVALDETGETRYRVVASPFGQGDDRGTLICLEDVSHLHIAGRMRRDFVANVSHELRTPLTAIVGFIETLQGPARKDEAAQTRFLSMMHKEAQRMNRLVGDLLSLSRVETVERQRPSAPVRVSGVLSASLSSLDRLSEQAGVKITTHLDDDTTCVPGDADQLRQVMNNLLENAIKYGSDGGEITLTVGTPFQDASLRARAVRITIKDQGAGIDPLHLPRLTERFYRVDEHRSREMGGTGLGLAIVKHIVNRHRGRMEIHSQPGKGSQFSVILPVL